MNNLIIRDRIQVILDKKKVTAAQMLSAIGLNKSYLSDMSSKNTTPSIEKILAIANYLEVSTDFLLKGSDICGFTDEEELELLTIYRTLDKRGRTMVQAAAYSESDRLQKEQPLGILANPKESPPFSGKETDMVQTGTSHPRVKSQRAKQNKAE